LDVCKAALSRENRLNHFSRSQPKWFYVSFMLLLYGIGEESILYVALTIVQCPVLAIANSSERMSILECNKLFKVVRLDEYHDIG